MISRVCVLFLVSLVFFGALIFAASAQYDRSDSEKKLYEEKGFLASFAEGILSVIRSAEVAYYASNGNYDDLATLTKAGYLDARFADGTFDENGIRVDFWLPKTKQMFYASAYIYELDRELTLDQTGEITYYGSDLIPNTKQILSMISDAEKEFYSDNKRCGDLGELASDNYLNRWFTDGSYDKDDVQITGSLSEDGNHFYATAYIEDICAFMTLNWDGSITNFYCGPVQQTYELLDMVRRGEARYYAKNGYYGTFDAVVTSGFLHPWFAEGTYDSDGIKVTIEVPEGGQIYFVVADVVDYSIELTLNESGEIKQNK